MDRARDQCGEQMLDLVAGERDQIVRLWVMEALGGCGHGEEDVGKHREGDPAVPRGPAADLVFVESGQALARLKGLLHRPAPASHAYQVGQRYRAGREAAVEGELAGTSVATDQ